MADVFLLIASGNRRLSVPGKRKMKPETEHLLHRCRSALLQQSNEQLNTLFVSWFERLVGEESVDEALDDLCLLLGYGIRSLQSQILYDTYTSWWEVEGCVDLDGEFVCAEGAALQHRLITMSIKQFALLADLAYHVCVLDAEVEGQPCPPTGQEWLRTLTIWLGAGAREPFHGQSWRNEPQTPPPIAQPQLTRKQRRAQQRKLEQELVEQAWQCGYLLLSPEVGTQVPILVQSRCRKNRRPYISVQQRGAQVASICIDVCTVRKAFEREGKLFSGAPLPTFTPTDEIGQRLTRLAAQYSAGPKTAGHTAYALSPQGDIIELKQVLQADVPGAVADFLALWPDILTQYEAQLQTSRVAYQERQRELEEARKPAWIKALAALSAQGQVAPLPGAR